MAKSKKKTTKESEDAIRKLLTKIDNQKQALSDARDELRQTYCDLQDIVESTDDGIDEINSGLRLIEDGLGTVSQHI